MLWRDAAMLQVVTGCHRTAMKQQFVTLRSLSTARVDFPRNDEMGRPFKLLPFAKGVVWRRQFERSSSLSTAHNTQEHLQIIKL